MPEEEHNISFSGKPTKKNYDVHFDRSPFIKSVLQPEINTNEKINRTSQGKYSYKESPTTDTVPNLNFIFDNGLEFDLHPADWFDPYFPRKRKESTHPKAVTLDDRTGWLNVKAMMANAECFYKFVFLLYDFFRYFLIVFRKIVSFFASQAKKAFQNY